MGPAQTNVLPTRPRFAWDSRSPPWTDGKGNQERFKTAVYDWKEYHDSLPDTSANKLAPSIQAIVLKSQLYGQAADLIAELTNEQLKSENGVKLIVDAVYQRDFLSVISEAFDGFNVLLNTRRSSNESLKSFETRFSAAVTRFNSLSNTTRLPQCITALMLLSNSSIEHSQRISALAAAAPTGTVFSDQSSNDDYLKAVTYKQLASVVKQCEKASNAISNPPLSASSAGTNISVRRVRNSGYRRPSNAALKRLPCHSCGKYGHWKDSHNEDGSLKPGVKAFDNAADFNSSLGSTGRGSQSYFSGNVNDSGKKKTVSFNMAAVSSRRSPTNLSHNSVASENFGPLVDDGAPYSAIGNIELSLLLDLLGNSESITLDPIPSSLHGHTHWQYGMGEHSSAPRSIIGSVVIPATSDSGRLVQIRHLVLDGSSQWVIGKNVTQRANILHVDRNALEFFADGTTDYFKMINKDFLSYLPISTFANKTFDTSVLSCLNGNLSTDRSQSQVKAIVDKVHKHICGHANLTDMKLLLQRNGMWSDSVSDYVSEMIKNCASCRATAPPEPNRKVSISSMSREFNDVVCIDHFYLESVSLFHAMDIATRFSAAFVVKSTSLDEAVLGFESCWASQFWLPASVQGDDAFGKGAFRQFLDDRSISFRLVPPRRHSKNPLESKHGIIRNIFLKLCSAEPSTAPELHALRAVSISNDLYGNDVMSAFELAKGFTRPLADGSISSIPSDIVDAHNRLQAKRKLALILRSKSTQEPQIATGDMIEVFSNTGMGKKGKWSTPKIVLAVDAQARTVLVPAKGGRRSTVAFEDIRPALLESSFAQAVQAAIDAVDDAIDDALPSTKENDDANVDCIIADHAPSHATHEDADFSDDHINPAHSHPNASTVRRGDRVKVYWPIDKVHYSGTVKTLHKDGCVTVLYDDGDKERLNLDSEKWEYENSPMTSNSCSVTTNPTVTDHEPYEIRRMLDHFGNKTFMRHQAQGFEQYTLAKSYGIEEETFLKSVRVVPCCDVPSDANVINSHVLYKVKKNDGGSLKLKARIAPHGNEDDLKTILASDCTSCPPTGVRIVESISSLFGWKLYKADVTAAFLQTGSASRDVYVKPPKESRMRSTHLWLLLTAAYGLVNANAKWQVKSDECFFRLGLNQCQQVPQLFYKHDNGKLMLVVAKIVDDIKAAGSNDSAKTFIEKFNAAFKLGTISHGPGCMRFFGINSIQEDDLTVSTNADDKLNDLTEYPFSRDRRKQFDQPLNDIEKAFFASTNSSLGWIGTAASPFCSFYASYLQQKAPETKVCHLIEQLNVVRKLKKLGTLITYPRPTDKSDYELSVTVFADASKRDEHGQIGVLTGLLVGKLANNSIYHPVSWISHKSKRPVKSVPAAEILASAEAIDEAKCVAHAYSEILNMDIRVHLCVDSKDLFTSLSTQRNSIDRSIRGDVASIRFEFQVGNVERITWIPGKINLADALTKKDSPLTDALQLTLYTGRMKISFEDFAETKSTDKNYG